MMSSCLCVVENRMDAEFDEVASAVVETGDADGDDTTENSV